MHVCMYIYKEVVRKQLEEDFKVLSTAIVSGAHADPIFDLTSLERDVI